MMSSDFKLIRRLESAPGVGPAKIREVAEKIGRESSGFSLLDLQKRHLLSPSTYELVLRSGSSIDSYSEIIVETCAKHGIEIITIFDSRYPLSLRSISDPPSVLYCKGNLDLLSHPSVAIVGSRDANLAAQNFAKDVARKVVEGGAVVVSGGALGIDAAAHVSALDAGGKTLFVFGTGILRPYPPENFKLFTLSPNKLIISELPPMDSGSRFSFLKRNRITSGIAHSVVICAARASGGSMVQANLAARQGRPILVPPDSIGAEPSEGLSQMRVALKARSFQ